MGTNYYARYNMCKCCGRYELIHIGKSSIGWEFSFHGYGNDYEPFIIKSFKDWIKIIKEKEMDIVDEYDDVISLNELIDLVKSKKGGENMYKYTERGVGKHQDFEKSLLKHMWKDDEGNSFSDRDFS